MVISSHGQLVTGQLVTANCLLQHSAILAVLMFRFMFWIGPVKILFHSFFSRITFTVPQKFSGSFRVVWNPGSGSFSRSRDPINIPTENLCQFCNPHLYDYLCRKVDKDRSSHCWDIQSDRPILPSCPKTCNSYHRSLSGYWTITKIVFNVEKFILLNILKLKLPYCNPFWIPDWLKWECAIFFTKLDAMATSLQVTEKEVKIDHLHSKHFHLV